MLPLFINFTVNIKHLLSMLTSVNCIALNTIKYSDKHSILSAYSLELGYMSFLVPVGDGKEARRRKAMLMPLSMFHCVADIRVGRDINVMRDLSTDMVLSDIHFHPVKSSISFFISEILSVILREYQEDKILYYFLQDSLQMLNSINKGISNFHICFLVKLIRYLGLEPDYSTYKKGAIFDYAEGLFRSTPPLHTHFLSIEDSEILYKLSRMKFENMYCFKFSRMERQQILDALLRYYAMHYNAISTLSSLDVLKELFD